MERGILSIEQRKADYQSRAFHTGRCCPFGEQMCLDSGSEMVSVGRETAADIDMVLVSLPQMLRCSLI